MGNSNAAFSRETKVLIRNVVALISILTLVAIIPMIFGLAGCTDEKNAAPEVHTLAPEVQTKIEQANAPLDLDDFPAAKQEISEEVHSCGPGVVPGVEGENRCGYQIMELTTKDADGKPHLNEIALRPMVGKTGLLHDPDEMYQANITFLEVPEDVTIPERFDLRDYMKAGRPEIKQQQCGDCWSWAAHHSMEINRAVHEGKVTDHSSQFVLSCSDHGSCGGGYMSVMEFLIGRGGPLETENPYLGGKTGSCKYSKDELNAGKWDGKILASPYIGNSLMYSRAAKRNADGQFAQGPKVEQMQRAMVQWRSPLVVTVSAFSVGEGVYDNCRAINSGGNHMVDITGWEKDSKGEVIAHVWNSWGKSFGGNSGQGVGKTVWECGDDKLNHGLGRYARIATFKAPCSPADPSFPKAKYVLFKEEGSMVLLGKKQPEGVKCSWLPETGLDDPKSCQVYASPDMTTEYHLTVENGCGKASAMTLVEVWKPTYIKTNEFMGKDKRLWSKKSDILTPLGVVDATEIKGGR